MFRKGLTIFLLWVFGVSTFTFKTHYCYHPDGTRFHGDCSAGRQEAQKEGGAHFHERHYICYDLQFDKQYTQHGYTFPNFQDHCFVLPNVQVLLPCVARRVEQAIPVFASRGGPPLAATLLRGPPAI